MFEKFYYEELIEINLFPYFVWIILLFNIFLYAQSTMILQLSSYQWPKKNLIEKLWNLEDLVLRLSEIQDFTPSLRKRIIFLIYNMIILSSIHPTLKQSYNKSLFWAYCVPKSGLTFGGPNEE